MNLVLPSAFPTCLIDGAEILRTIESAGRTCYKSEDRMTADSAAKFVRGIIDRGHEAVLEHVNLTARIICDRGVSHEIVRHRLASYCQESTRYCNYGSEDVQFILPPWFRGLKTGTYAFTLGRKVCWFSGDCVLDDDNTPSVALRWLRSCLESEEHYKWLINSGQKPQEARAVLTNSLKTELVMTANLREWRHFFRLRCSKAAHPQMREVAMELLERFSVIPVVFDDIIADLKKEE